MIPATEERKNETPKDGLAEDEYFVEKILDKKLFDGKECYLVKWEGYPQCQCTWEPKTNLRRSQDLIDQYEREHKHRAKPESYQCGLESEPLRQQHAELVSKVAEAYPPPKLALEGSKRTMPPRKRVSETINAGFNDTDSLPSPPKNLPLNRGLRDPPPLKKRLHRATNAGTLVPKPTVKAKANDTRKFSAVRSELEPALKRPRQYEKLALDEDDDPYFEAQEKVADYIGESPETETDNGTFTQNIKKYSKANGRGGVLETKRGRPSTRVVDAVKGPKPNSTQKQRLREGESGNGRGTTLTHNGDMSSPKGKKRRGRKLDPEPNIDLDEDTNNNHPQEDSDSNWNPSEEGQKTPPRNQGADRGHAKSLFKITTKEAKPSSATGKCAHKNQALAPTRIAEREKEPEQEQDHDPDFDFDPDLTQTQDKTQDNGHDYDIGPDPEDEEGNEKPLREPTRVLGIRRTKYANTIEYAVEWNVPAGREPLRAYITSDEFLTYWPKMMANYLESHIVIKDNLPPQPTPSYLVSFCMLCYFCIPCDVFDSTPACCF